MDDFIYRDHSGELRRVRRCSFSGLENARWDGKARLWDWANSQPISAYAASTIYVYEPHRVLSLGEIEEAGLLGGVELLGVNHKSQ